MADTPTQVDRPQYLYEYGVSQNGVLKKEDSEMPLSQLASANLAIDVEGYSHSISSTNTNWPGYAFMDTNVQKDCTQSSNLKDVAYFYNSKLCLLTDGSVKTSNGTTVQMPSGVKGVQVGANSILGSDHHAYGVYGTTVRRFGGDDIVSVVRQVANDPSSAIAIDSKHTVYRYNWGQGQPETSNKTLNIASIFGDRAVTADGSIYKIQNASQSVDKWTLTDKITPPSDVKPSKIIASTGENHFFFIDQNGRLYDSTDPTTPIHTSSIRFSDGYWGTSNILIMLGYDSLNQTAATQRVGQTPQTGDPAASWTQVAPYLLAVVTVVGAVATVGAAKRQAM